MKRILLVDDEPHVLRLMKLALERAAYHVDTALSGEQALVCIKENQPDVMITDIDMPRMAGDELCKRISTDMPDREFMIIVLTSRVEVEHREWSSKIANLVFSEKPVSIRKLLTQLEEHFEKVALHRENRIAG